MFDWITKPYIQWNIIDTMLCYIEIGLTAFIVILLVANILDFKDKIKNKKNKK